MGPAAPRLLACLVVLAAACTPLEEPARLPDIDPAATFVAHSVHGGLAIDRLGTTSGRLEARTFGRFVLRADGAPIADLRVTGPATVVARAGTTPVTVSPAWIDQAVRLTLVSDAETLRAGPFVRTDARAGLETLSRLGQTSLDVRGTFRASVLDERGAPRGWLEVRVPGPDEPRVFSASLPDAPATAGPALALALASELDWIDDHVIDVHRGSDHGRSAPGRGR